MEIGTFGVEAIMWIQYAKKKAITRRYNNESNKY